MHGEGAYYAFGMGGGGLLFWLIGAALIIIPFWKILPRAGVSSAWALLAIIPLAALILLWVLAFKTWPGDHAREEG